jgi:hypothetical protein
MRRKALIIFLLIILVIIFYLLPLLASKTLDYFLMKSIEERVGEKAEVQSSASPFFLFNQRFRYIRGKVENFHLRGFPEGEVDFSLSGGKIIVSSFFRGEDVSSWFLFDSLEVQGRVSEENLNKWLEESNHRFRVDFKDNKLILIWEKDSKIFRIPGKLEAKEGRMYFVPEMPAFLQLFLGKKEIAVWERPEISFSSVVIEGNYLLWEGKINEEVFKKRV